MQTREYGQTDVLSAMKAVIAAFQDQGYVISTAEIELGLVTAALEFFEEDTDTKSFNEFMYGPGQGTYQTTKRLVASATVSKREGSVRVRINIIAKAITNTGGIIWSQPVYDVEKYQSIFAIMDKALFLQKEGI